jgi:uncharacterized protein (TIGR03118 family)
MNLVNAWGLVAGPMTPWWVADNGTGLSTLYNAAGDPQSLVVTIPAPQGDPDPSKPTGAVFNGTTDFVVSDGTNSGPARFIFATEDGTIAAWSPGVPPPPPSHQAFLVAGDIEHGAVYKGLAMGQSATRGNLLYATDFHNARVDIFGAMFQPVTIKGAFTDPGIPSGFAPFGIQNINGSIFVTYAMQDDMAHDNVSGHGLGFVDEFSTDGGFIRRFASRAPLDAPWGVALAPADFGHFKSALLVGNFGDGRINAFDIATGEFIGPLRNIEGGPVAIDGLWGIGFGNGAAAGPTNVLYFTAGPQEESHGLFGSIEFVGAHGRH